MQKKIVLVPIAAVIGLAAGIPGGMLHSNLVKANYRQQQIALQRQNELKQEAERKARIQKAKLAKEQANKVLPINISAKNDQIAVKATEIQTGQLLYTGGPKAKKRYVVIHLTITNHGTNAIMFQRNDFKLQTGHDTVSQTKLVSKDKVIGKAIINKPIAVGAKMTAYIAFDTAGANDKNKTLIISNSYNNSFDKPLKINLNSDNSNKSDSNLEKQNGKQDNNNDTLKSQSSDSSAMQGGELK